METNFTKQMNDKWIYNIIVFRHIYSTEQYILYSIIRMKTEGFLKKQTFVSVFLDLGFIEDKFHSISKIRLIHAKLVWVVWK